MSATPISESFDLIEIEVLGIDESNLNDITERPLKDSPGLCINTDTPSGEHC